MRQKWIYASAGHITTDCRRRTAHRCGANSYTAKSSPPERLDFISSFSDEKGGTTRHPGHASWPLEMHSTFTFEELPGGKTKFTVSWVPRNATEEERKTFEAGRDSMRMGWTGTFEQLEAYLAKAK